MGLQKKSYSYDLIKNGSGVNWISVPGMNPPITIASELMNDIPNMVPGDNVKWKNSTSQEREVWTRSPYGYDYGDDFPVTPARGYEISIGINTTWTPS